MIPALADKFAYVTAPVRRSYNRLLVTKGRNPGLQEKTWQVLLLLQDKSPELVSRSEIIELVWGGQWFTGEKGLNQAIWSLRKILNDNARSPSFIRTVPRKGYQWIHSRSPSKIPLKLSKKTVSITGSLALVLALSGSTMLLHAPGTAAKLASGSGGTVKSELLAATVVEAYLSDQNIVLRMGEGCHGYIVPSDGKVFGLPTISNNGQQVAFSVYQDNHCKTVTINVSDQSHQEFNFCPTDPV